MTFEELKTPEELMEYMNKNIQYGWVDKEGQVHINELKGLREKYRVSSLEEMIEKGVGTCIEQANMIKTFFDKIGLECKIFCHRSYETEENYDKEVHMHCLVFYKNGDKWYHFEHSNEGERGIHEYNSYEEGLNKRIERFEAKGDIRKLTEIPYIPVGLTFKEFNQFVNQFDNIKTL